MPLVEYYVDLQKPAGTMVAPDVDSLSSENGLIFTNGPLAGIGCQTGNRLSITTKSPLTDTMPDALNIPSYSFPR
jgi:aldehyde:ferredoxin oxidoreductase